MCIYGRANTHTGGYEFMKVDFNEMEIIMIKQVMTMILAFFPPELQLSDNKILLLLFITAMFICVCSNILLVHSILEGEKKMKKICSIFGSFLLLLVFGFIICMTKYLFGRYF